MTTTPNDKQLMKLPYPLYDRLMAKLSIGELNLLNDFLVIELSQAYQRGREETELKIRVEKADTMRKGFAAYHVGSYRKKGEPVVLLNIYATLAACLEEDISIKQQIIESLMHEFGHVLEEFYDKEFDEDFIESVVMSYREKYGGDQPNELLKKD